MIQRAILIFLFKMLIVRIQAIWFNITISEVNLKPFSMYRRLLMRQENVFLPLLQHWIIQRCELKSGMVSSFSGSVRSGPRGVEAGYSTVDVMDPDVPEDGRFDVIITDNSNMDDLGTINEALFGLEYFKNIHDVLRPPHGIMSSLGEALNIFVLFLNIIKRDIENTFTRLAAFNKMA